MRDLVICPCSPARRSASPFRERLLDRLQCDVISPLATHDFVKQSAIERQQRGSLFRAGRVVAVKPIHYESELQARSEWRRSVRVDVVNADISSRYVGERRLETIHVESILQYLAVGLDENRKARELPHGLQQIQRLQSLQPERH